MSEKESVIARAAPVIASEARQSTVVCRRHGLPRFARNDEAPNRYRGLPRYARNDEPL